ncbi:ABC transporter ATP-binding protein [Polaribacter aquimarinus]|uniref:ABC transporter ATP-binding protein n=1 Tax=Polaribacter aquimarinus TaxID=2100726 RepID=A0A2U2J827_9FLAO|nr:ABC transporter ATP-binding protein [Polaribacter aquimarinus]PWG04495.1 ABC transporter ATP-binding protein [Polaribacter aquimarinus]
METNTILKIENLSKQYRLGVVGTGTIAHDINRFIAKVRGKDDPYLKIGESNDRSSKGNSEYVWALKNINFDVNKGEVLGIIGKNGAGKSTLLKILSKVTGPTTGFIKSKGRIASLLEVGTGFHPEMTGRENIFLNGAILGMTKKEIQSKLDEIVSFSGCERYIDTPVKRYSSGMTVRLAFSVAAHLEPDILIVDEVLAVGDAEFQKKAIGKMQNISNSDGRTVLFVSHNMSAIKNLCSRVIVLENGTVKFQGKTEEALDAYLSKNYQTNYFINFLNNKTSSNKEIQFKSIQLRNQLNKKTKDFSIGDDLNIDLTIINASSEAKIDLGIQVKSIDDFPIFHIMGRDSNYDLVLEKKEETFSVSIKDIRLFPGVYSINLTCNNLSGHQIFDAIENAITFEIIDGGKYTNRQLPKAAGLFFLNPEWKKLDL